jgi:hypothetical protein
VPQVPWIQEGRQGCCQTKVYLIYM